MKINIIKFSFILVIIILNLPFNNYNFITPADAVSPGYIMGRVTLPDGKAGIDSCEIQLIDKNNEVVSKLNTDAQGNFYITNVNPSDVAGFYRVRAIKGSWGESTTQQFSVISNTSIIIAIRMYPRIGDISFTSSSPEIKADNSSTVDLTIIVRDMAGKPVPDGYNIKLSQESYYPFPGYFIGDDKKTDITLPLKNGAIVVKYGLIPGEILSRKVNLTAIIAESPGEKRTILLNIAAVNPNLITGTVYDGSSKPVAYANVLLEKWDGSRFVSYNSSEDPANKNNGNTFANAQGVYRYEILPAGDYKITASEGDFKNSTTFKVIRGPYSYDIIIPSLKRGLIKGMVLDINSTPVAGADVALKAVRNDRLEKVANTTSDINGGFIFNDLRYGNYCIEANKNGMTANAPVYLDVDRASASMIFTSSLPVATQKQDPDTSSNSTSYIEEPVVTPVSSPEPPSDPIYNFSVAIAGLFIAGVFSLAMILMVTKK
jgi:protocatechuate 3,4-dioxygenase beta subunit